MIFNNFFFWIDEFLPLHTTLRKVTELPSLKQYRIDTGSGSLKMIVILKIFIFNQDRFFFLFFLKNSGHFCIYVLSGIVVQ